MNRVTAPVPLVLLRIEHLLGIAMLLLFVASIGIRHLELNEYFYLRDEMSQVKVTPIVDLWLGRKLLCFDLFIKATPLLVGAVILRRMASKPSPPWTSHVLPFLVFSLWACIILNLFGLTNWITG